MTRLLLLIAFSLSVSAAQAGIAPAQLDSVRVDAKPGATFPMSLRFADLKGATRTLADVVGDGPAVVVFADYTCTNLCGPILTFAAAGLASSGLAPGRDFRLVVIGLDPKDGQQAAREMIDAQLGREDAVAKASVFLIGNAPAIEAATQAAGYHYAYDREHDQFAHPAAAFVIARNGAIVRVLSGLGLTGDNLRLALIDAGKGRVGSLLDQIRLHCFGFDAARGIYTASIVKTLTIACCATLVLLIGGIGWLALARRARATA